MTTTPSATTLSTHVLDAALGRPGAGIEVLLDGETKAVTDADGRVRFEDPIAAGEHRLSFATGAWFAAQERETFYPSVDLIFWTSTDEPHYHVALLLSPFAYTTYRGS